MSRKTPSLYDHRTRALLFPAVLPQPTLLRQSRLSLHHAAEPRDERGWSQGHSMRFTFYHFWID